VQAASRSISVGVIPMRNNVNAPVCVAVINSSHYGGHYSFGNIATAIARRIDASELISFDRPRICDRRDRRDVSAAVIEIW